MNKSRYAEKYARAVETARDTFVVPGDVLVVERMPKIEVKTKSGLIASVTPEAQMNSLNANLPEFVHVIGVGAGFVDTDGSEVNVDTKVGSVVLIPKDLVQWWAALPDVTDYEPYSVGQVSEANIRMRWDSVEAYEAWAKAFNG